MDYELQALDHLGNGTAILIMDDGTRHIQMLRGMPVHDDDALHDALVVLCEEVAARNAPRPPRDQKIDVRIGKLVAALRKPATPSPQNGAGNTNNGNGPP
jgi:hypothetical protein